MQEKFIRDIFDVSLVIKGIDGVLEIIGGIFFFFIQQNQLITITKLVVQRELIEDPQDFTANYLIATSHVSVSLQFFTAIYLLIHGVIKIVIVVGLLKNKLWAYPLGITVFSAFVLYQLYQYGY